MFIDRKYRLPRVWSNSELKRIAPLFHGTVVNVSAWKDSDKEELKYKDYFINAELYSITNFPGERGLQYTENECELDLEKDLPDALRKKFDVVLSHTTLEHIFQARKAFRNLCSLSRDIVIIVVPFAQIQHETSSWKDFWRFTPSCLRLLFAENDFEVIYEKESRLKESSVYLFFVASRYPDQWKDKMPLHKRIDKAGIYIGSESLIRIFLKRLKSKFLNRDRTGIKFNSNSSFAKSVEYDFKRRIYSNYDEYLSHQSEKLPLRKDEIESSDKDYEEILKKRMRELENYAGKTMLCLGARLGGEVRAFKSLGALAIGVDIEPGPLNSHVLYGDFHDLQFSDMSFNMAFTNAIDHVYDLRTFAKEVSRILKPDGLFFVELAVVTPGRYEVIDTSDPKPIIQIIKQYFQTISSVQITNKSRFINWSGILYTFRKINA